MKRISRQLLLVLSVLFMMLVISGCGSSLQKPTGLETKEQPIAEVVDDISPDVIGEEAVPDTIVQEELADKKEIGGGKQEIPASPKQEAVVKPESKTIDKPKSDQQSLKPVDHSKPSVEANKPPVNQPTNEASKSTATTTQSEAVKPTPPVPAPTKSNPETPAPEKPATEPESKASTIIISIVISASEIPLPSTTLEIKDGDTVLKALIDITKNKQIQMDYRGGQGSTAYVEGINNVYEFDRGQGSGWMYRINGVFPDRGAGAIKLLDGDRVEWLYTTNLGDDLNADLKPFRR